MCAQKEQMNDERDKTAKGVYVVVDEGKPSEEGQPTNLIVTNLGT